MNGLIAAVADPQPLGEDSIWRITLAGESFGRLVRREERKHGSTVAVWQLLQLDDITDAQLETYETAMQPPE